MRISQKISELSEVKLNLKSKLVNKAYFHLEISFRCLSSVICKNL